MGMCSKPYKACGRASTLKKACMVKVSLAQPSGIFLRSPVRHRNRTLSGHRLTLKPSTAESGSDIISYEMKMGNAGF